MFFKGVAEEGGEFVPALMLVLVVLLGRRSSLGPRWVIGGRDDVVYWYLIQ